MIYAELKTADILAILGKTPDCFAAVALELGDGRLKWKPSKKTWSLNDNLAHIRACADVWGETIEQMLYQDEPTLSHLHPREHMRQNNLHRLDYPVSFNAYRNQRRYLLERLGNLEDSDWQRGALIRTKVKLTRHTVFSQARRMALHEQRHCRQIQALVTALENNQRLTGLRSL